MEKKTSFKGKQNIPMTLIKVLDLHVVCHFNILPKILPQNENTFLCLSHF